MNKMEIIILKPKKIIKWVEFRSKIHTKCIFFCTSANCAWNTEEFPSIKSTVFIYLTDQRAKCTMCKCGELRNRFYLPS